MVSFMNTPVFSYKPPPVRASLIVYVALPPLGQDDDETPSRGSALD